MPQWLLGASTFASPGASESCACSQAGLGQLAVLETARATLTLDLPFTAFGSVRADGDRVVFCAGAPDHPSSIVALDLRTGRHTVLKKSTGIVDRGSSSIAEYLAGVETVEFPTTGGTTAFDCSIRPAIPTTSRRRTSGRRCW